MEGHKIEFRAVPYGNDAHVLEWRYAPDQDLKYKQKRKLFFGLITYTVTKTHSTKWRSIEVFHNYCTSYLYDIDFDFHYSPIFVESKDDLAIKWQGQFVTVEEFRDYIEKYEEEEMNEYNKERKEYLDSRQIWE